MTDAVHTPSAEQERPRTTTALVTAVVCFALGLASVLTLTRHADQTDRATASPATAPHATQPPTPEVHASAPGPAATKPAAPEPAPITPPVTTATPEPAKPSTQPRPAAATTAPELNVIQGRVAYLRCDGLSGERGRFPCPRDSALERAVWDVLNGLPTCVPSLGRGGADIRLDIARDQKTEARVLAVAGAPEPSLDPQAIQACIGPRLKRLQTSLDPIYMMISFRFSLR